MTGELPRVAAENTKPAGWSRAAVASLVLGLLSVLLLIVTGLPALYLGYRGLVAVNTSDGRLRGRRLAQAGMALGGLATIVTLAWAIILGFVYLNSLGGRADSTNNLRVIGLAMPAHAENHDQHYPQATIANPALKPDQRLSWLVAILPYLERKTTSREKWQALVTSVDLKQGWEADVNRTARTTTVPTFLCQGHSDDRRADVGVTNYVGLAGVGVDAARLPRDAADAGFFGYDRIVTVAQMDERRSYTLIVTETTNDLGPWVAGGSATVRGVDPAIRPLFGPGAPFGGCMKGGHLTLWLDGSVRYETDSVAPDLFARMTRINKAP